MQQKPPQINLLRNKGVNYIDRFINWALTGGRMIVVLTEIIALSAFIYRFSLDRQIIDLHNKIRQEQNIVEYYKQEEATYRNLQDRLTLANQTGTTEAATLNTMQDIFQLLPVDVIVSSVTYDNTKVQITATMQSVSALKNFVKRLSDYKQTGTLSIDTIENKPQSSLINTTVSLTLKTQGKLYEATK